MWAPSLFFVAPVLLCASSSGLRVLRSLLSPSDPNPYSVAKSRGARENVEVKDVTICMRY